MDSNCDKFTLTLRPQHVKGGVIMFDYIVTSANLLIEKHETRNPLELAGLLGIYVARYPLGGLKGFYKVINRERHIVLNESLEEWEWQIVLAHEIGHDQLHKHIASLSTMCEHSLLFPSGKTEQEANLFAAELLLSDAEMLDHMANQLTLDQLSQRLHLPKEFLQYKIYILARRYPLLKIYMPELISNFLI